MYLKKTFRQLYRKTLEKMPMKLALNIENFRGYHKFVNFKNPKYFGEKIQWLKMYGNLEKYNDYVDKLLVRDYIKKTIGEDYLIPLLGAYDSADEIDFETLPLRFVIKLNTGSGYNIIVKNKEIINRNEICKKITKWLREDYSKMKKEPQYKNVVKKILVEKYMEDSNKLLLDYKFFCFEGKAEFLKVDYDRYVDHRVNFYDKEWNLLNIREGNFQNYTERQEEPKNFEKMVEIAEKLSKRFDFVRVDLYNLDGKIYFGELTFTPAAGINPFKPLEKDIEIASKINLNK